MYRFYAFIDDLFLVEIIILLSICFHSFVSKYTLLVFTNKIKNYIQNNFLKFLNRAIFYTVFLKMLFLIATWKW